MNRFIQLFSNHQRFPQINELLSVNSGVIGYREGNCRNLKEVGSKAIPSIFHENFERLQFKRKDAEVSHATVTSCTKMKKAKVAESSHLVCFIGCTLTSNHTRK